MMHLPTTKQLKEFLKDNKKTVWLTALATLLLYALGIGYTLFSNGSVEEEQEIDPDTSLEGNLITGK